MIDYSCLINKAIFNNVRKLTQYFVNNPKDLTGVVQEIDQDILP
jgi:hypothetical protein